MYKVEDDDVYDLVFMIKILVVFFMVMELYDRKFIIMDIKFFEMIFEYKNFNKKNVILKYMLFYYVCL